jgi:hypothetical protein
MGTAIALVALLFPLQVSPAPLAGWKDFSPKGGGFIVKMPADPEETTRTIEAVHGTTRVRQFGVERDGVAYMVTRTDLPPAAVAGGPRKTLDEARDEGVRKSGGTLKEERAIELDGHPGREMVLELPETRARVGGIYTTRIYLVGRTHYQIARLSPKGKERPAETKAFLESFRLKGEGATE